MLAPFDRAHLVQEHLDTTRAGRTDAQRVATARHLH